MKRWGSNILVAAVIVLMAAALLAPAAALANTQAAESDTFAAEADSGGRLDMSRIYNPNSGEHFYTSSRNERANLKGHGWRPEGVGWVSPEKSSTPVYRLYNPNAGDHHYTIGLKERNWLIGLGWRDEGVGWYSSDAQTVPVYRLYNPNATSGAHHYTTSAVERNWLIGLGWRDEGVGWHALSAGYGIDWVSELNLAKRTTQIITVEVSDKRAVVSLHEKTGGVWKQALSTSDGWIGRQGLGSADEWHSYTPRGIMWPDRAFGINDNPGCSLGYLKVNWSHYWVDDVNSSAYNKLVSTDDFDDFSSGEHLKACAPGYNYCLNMGWNKACTPGAGSAFFLHCHTGKGATGGCVTVPESTMKQILQRVRNGCAILIDTPVGCMFY